MSRSRALVRHDICFLLRRTYAPRRIYMSHRNRSAVGTASSYGIGTGFRGGWGRGGWEEEAEDPPRAGSYAARFDLRKRVVSPRLHRPTTRVRRRKKDSTLYILRPTRVRRLRAMTSVPRTRNSSERNFPLGLAHSWTRSDPQTLDCQVQKMLAAIAASTCTAGSDRRIHIHVWYKHSHSGLMIKFRCDAVTNVTYVRSRLPEFPLIYRLW